MSKLSFIAINFAMDFLLRSDLPPLDSNFQLKKNLKSPSKILSCIYRDIKNQNSSNFIYFCLLSAKDSLPR